MVTMAASPATGNKGEERSGADPGIVETAVASHVNAEGAERGGGVWGTRQIMKIRVPNKRFPGIWDQNPRSYS